MVEEEEAVRGGRRRGSVSERLTGSSECQSVSRVLEIAWHRKLEVLLLGAHHTNNYQHS